MAKEKEVVSYFGRYRTTPNDLKKLLLEIALSIY